MMAPLLKGLEVTHALIVLPEGAYYATVHPYYLRNFQQAWHFDIPGGIPMPGIDEPLIGLFETTRINNTLEEAVEELVAELVYKRQMLGEFSLPSAMTLDQACEHFGIEDTYREDVCGL